MANKLNMPALACMAVCIAVILMFFPACRKEDSSGRPIIAVSYDSQKWLLEQIVGDDYDIVVLLPPGRDSETYDPDISTMASLSNSKIYFTTSTLGFELSIKGKVAANFPDVKTLDVSVGIRPIEGTHGMDLSGSDHSHYVADPHLLTSITNARIIAANMLSGLSELQPDSAGKYARNFNSLDSLLYSRSKEIDSILGLNVSSGDAEVVDGNADNRQRGAFVVIHPFLTYFASERGLDQISLERNGKEVTPRQLKERIEEARKAQPSAVFYEPGKGENYAREVAGALGVRAYPVNVNDGDFVEILVEVSEILAGNGEKSGAGDADAGKK